MSKHIFVTGTGTDVGKTYVTALIVKKLRQTGLNAGYFKAAVSGNKRGILNGKEGLIPGDAAYVDQIAGIQGDLTEMVPYVYEHAVSPHLASRLEGNPVKLEVVKSYFQNICEKYEYVTVEGSGGILCPICFDEEKIWLEDIVKELDLDSILVADAGLGTINNVVLTASYMKQEGMKIKGIILNHFHPKEVMEEDNRQMITYMTGLPVIACVKPGDTELDIEAEELAALYRA
ncbi:MAG: dethiobiotin synthase [Lachnospiraceae bacterium]|nr:dethiobiotin synthase [Lachnospiraceae bacterium]